MSVCEWCQSSFAGNTVQFISSNIVEHDNIYYCWNKNLSSCDSCCFLQKKIIESMLCEDPEERPEASKLRAELEKWDEIFKAQKLRQESITM